MLVFHKKKENSLLGSKKKKNEFIQEGDSNNIFFDYDSDGDLDLIISRYNEEINDITSTYTFLYTNDDKGNFTKDTRSTLIGIKYGRIDVRDIDNDLDLVITRQELTKDKEGSAVIHKKIATFLKKKQKFEVQSK